MSIKIPPNMLQSVDAYLLDHQHYHSEFQIDCFITHRGGDHHPWGMFVQCLRELHARRKTLTDSEIAFDNNEIEIEESEWKMSKRAWSRKAKFAKRVEALRLKKLLIARSSFAKQFYETKRELTRFLDQIRVLRKQLRVETITPEKRLEFDRDYWLHRLKLRICVSIMTSNVVPADIFEMIPGLHLQVRQPLIEFIGIIQTREAAMQHLTSLASPESALQLRSA